MELVAALCLLFIHAARAILVRDILTEYVDLDGRSLGLQINHSLVVDIHNCLKGARDVARVTVGGENGFDFDLEISCDGVFAEWAVEAIELVPEKIKLKELSSCQSERQNQISPALLNTADSPGVVTFRGPNRNIAAIFEQAAADASSFFGFDSGGNATNTTDDSGNTTLVGRRRLAQSSLDQSGLTNPAFELRTRKRRELLNTQINLFLGSRSNFGEYRYYILPAACNQRQIQLAYLGSVANYATMMSCSESGECLPPTDFIGDVSKDTFGFRNEHVVNRLIGLQIPRWNYKSSKSLKQYQWYFRYLDQAAGFLEQTNELLYSVTQYFQDRGKYEERDNKYITEICFNDNVISLSEDDFENPTSTRQVDGACFSKEGKSAVSMPLQDISEDNQNSYAERDQVARVMHVLPIDRFLACADAQAHFLLDVAKPALEDDKPSIYLETTRNYLEAIGDPNTVQDLFNFWANKESLLYPLTSQNWNDEEKNLSWFNRLYAADRQKKNVGEGDSFKPAYLNWQFDVPCKMVDSDSFVYSVNSSKTEQSACVAKVDFSEIINASGGVLPDKGIDFPNGVGKISCSDIMRGDGTMKVLYDLKSPPKKHVSDTRCKFAVDLELYDSIRDEVLESGFQEEEEALNLTASASDRARFQARKSFDQFFECVPFALYTWAIYNNATAAVRDGWQGRKSFTASGAGQRPNLCTDWGEAELFCENDPRKMEIKALTCTGGVTNDFALFTEMLADSLLVAFDQSRDPLYEFDGRTDQQLLCGLTKRGAEETILFRSYGDMGSTEVLRGVECPCAIVEQQTSTRVCPVNFWAMPGYTGQLQACTREKGLPTCIPLTNTRYIGVEQRDTRAKAENRCNTKYMDQVMRKITVKDDVSPQNSSCGINYDASQCNPNEAQLYQCPFIAIKARDGPAWCPIVHGQKWLDARAWEIITGFAEYYEDDFPFYTLLRKNTSDERIIRLQELKDLYGKSIYDPTFRFFTSNLIRPEYDFERISCPCSPNFTEFHEKTKKNNSFCDPGRNGHLRDDCYDYFQSEFGIKPRNDSRRVLNPFYDERCFVNISGTTRCRGYQGLPLAIDQYALDNLKDSCVYYNTFQNSLNELFCGLESSSDFETGADGELSEANLRYLLESRMFDPENVDAMFSQDPSRCDKGAKGVYGDRAERCGAGDFFNSGDFGSWNTYKCVPSVVTTTSLYEQRVALYDISKQNTGIAQELGGVLQILKDAAGGKGKQGSLLDLAMRSAESFRSILSQWQKISDIGENQTSALLSNFNNERLLLDASISQLNDILTKDFPSLATRAETDFRNIGTSLTGIRAALVASSELAENFRQITQSMVDQHLQLSRDVDGVTQVSETLMSQSYAHLGRLQSFLHSVWRGKSAWRQHSRSLVEEMQLLLERNWDEDFPVYPFVSRFPEKRLSRTFETPREPLHPIGDLIKPWQIGLKGIDPSVMSESGQQKVAVSVQRIWSLVGVDSWSADAVPPAGSLPSRGFFAAGGGRPQSLRPGLYTVGDGGGTAALSHEFGAGWLWREVRLEMLCPVEWLLSSNTPSGINEFTIWDVLSENTKAEALVGSPQGCSVREVVHECRVPAAYTYSQRANTGFWSSPARPFVTGFADTEFSSALASGGLSLGLLLQKQRETLLNKAWASRVLARDFNSFSAEERRSIFGCGDGGAFLTPALFPTARPPNSGYEPLSLAQISGYARDEPGLGEDMSQAAVMQVSADLLTSELERLCQVRSFSRGGAAQQQGETEVPLYATVVRQHPYVLSTRPSWEMSSVALEAETWLLEENQVVDEVLASILNGSIYLRRSDICSRNTRMSLFVSGATQVLRDSLAVIEDGAGYAGAVLGGAVTDAGPWVRSLERWAREKLINVSAISDDDAPLQPLPQVDPTACSETSGGAPCLVGGELPWGGSLAGLVVNGFIESLRSIPSSVFWKESDLAYSGLTPVGGVKSIFEASKVMPFDPVAVDKSGGFVVDDPLNTDEALLKSDLAGDDDALVYNSNDIYSPKPVREEAGVNPAISTPLLEHELQKRNKAIFQRILESAPDHLLTGESTDPALSEMSYSRDYSRVENCVTSQWLEHGKYSLALHRLQLVPSSLRAKFSFRVLARKNIQSTLLGEQGPCREWREQAQNDNTTASAGNSSPAEQQLSAFLEQVQQNTSLVNSFQSVEVPLVDVDVLPDVFGIGKSWYWLGDPRCAQAFANLSPRARTFQTNEEILFFNSIGCEVDEDYLRALNLQGSDRLNVEARDGSQRFVYDISARDIAVGPLRENKINALSLLLELPDPYTTRYTYERSAARQAMFSYEDWVWQQFVLPAGYGLYRGVLGAEKEPSDMRPISPYSRLRRVDRSGRCAAQNADSGATSYETCAFLSNFRVLGFEPPISSGPGGDSYKRGRLRAQLQLGSAAGFDASSATVKIPLSQDAIDTSFANSVPCPTNLYFDFPGANSFLVYYDAPYGLESLLRAVIPQLAAAQNATDSLPLVLPDLSTLEAAADQINLGWVLYNPPTENATEANGSSAINPALNTSLNTEDGFFAFSSLFTDPAVPRVRLPFFPRISGTGGSVNLRQLNPDFVTSAARLHSLKLVLEPLGLECYDYLLPRLPSEEEENGENAANNTISRQAEEQRNRAVDYSVYSVQTVHNLAMTEVTAESALIHDSFVRLFNFIVNNVTDSYIRAASDAQAEYIIATSAALDGLEQNNINFTTNPLPRPSFTNSVSVLSRGERTNVWPKEELANASDALDQDLETLLQLIDQKTGSALYNQILNTKVAIYKELIIEEIDENSEEVFNNTFFPNNQTCQNQKLLDFVNSGQSEVYNYATPTIRKVILEELSALDCFLNTFASKSPNDVLAFLRNSTLFAEIIANIDKNLVLQALDELASENEEASEIMATMLYDENQLDQRTVVLDRGFEIWTWAGLGIGLGLGVMTVSWCLFSSTESEEKYCSQGAGKIVFIVQISLSAVFFITGLVLFFTDSLVRERRNATQ